MENIYNRLEESRISVEEYYKDKLESANNKCIDFGKIVTTKKCSKIKYP